MPVALRSATGSEETHVCCGAEIRFVVICRLGSAARLEGGSIIYAIPAGATAYGQWGGDADRQVVIAVGQPHCRRLQLATTLTVSAVNFC